LSKEINFKKREKAKKEMVCIWRDRGRTWSDVKVQRRKNKGFCEERKIICTRSASESQGSDGSPIP